MVDILNAYPERIVLKTTKGFEVPNEVGPPLPDYPKHVLDAQFDKEYPQAIRWTTATSKYNCFGMAIANRWAHIDSWEAVDQVLKDEYDLITEQDTVPGDLACYRTHNGELEHMGIVSRLESLDYREKRPKSGPIAVYVLSKWGQAAEYEHLLANCPYKECAIEFWRAKGKENNR